MNRINALSLALFLLTANSWAQNPAYNWEEKTSADGKYAYKTVSNDPLGVRIYTLKNGLTVMTSVNKNDPRIQTLIATKAGSKNDPADNTGLAHYLEHMLFKGTDKYGTKDWVKEKEQLDVIDALYERYNSTTNEQERKAIYRQIDSVSLLASQFAIANEYDKMVGAIGATGTNAFTSLEQTVYVNDIPTNQLENWVLIEAERFRNPVLRLFHTELEAVYEEKNISLDNDSRKVYETLLSSMFQNHAYGTQTTIGTVEHLKNPSLIKIRNYYNTYYVPNNMAIILAGDFNPDEAVAMIDKNFGYLQPKPVPSYNFGQEKANNAPVVKSVYGPDAESLMMGFRMPGAGTREEMLLTLVDYILSNSKAGLIDLNLVKKQLVVSAYSSTWINKDYSMHFLGGKPREGQKLEEVKDLLLSQLQAIKEGKFDESLLTAIINNFKVEQIQSNESNDGRAYNMLDAFTVGKDWIEEVKSIDDMSKITKQEIVNFANQYYANDYVIVYKRLGEDTSIKKIEKPEITAVEVNRTDESPFVKNILSRKVPAIKPVFIDYNKDITKSSLGKNVPVFYVRNKDNGLFNMYYVLDMGKLNDKKLPIAIDYLKYAGTSKYSSEDISKEFYKLACEFGVSSGEDQTYVYLSGLDENFEAAVKLFEHLLSDIQPNQKVLDQMIERILKQRSDAKLNKSAIFWSALRSYMIYGSNNPFKNILSEDELKSLKAEEMASIIKSITSYKHSIYYYGPKEIKPLNTFLASAHTVPAKLNDYPAAAVFTRNETNTPKVYFVDYKMVQAEVVWLNKQPQRYDVKLIPDITLFNEYYGGGMSSVVFQTIRESKALAYSTFSRYSNPSKPTDPYYVIAYVGTQADKMNEAIPAMNELLNEMPISENALANVKEALKNQIETERTTKEGILFAYMNAQKFGYKEDPNKATYNNLNSMNTNTIKTFFEKNYKGKTYHYGIMGSKDRINIEDLKKYGEVQEVSLKEIFGY
jgi:predicted Zn-dependent peptidase